LFLQQLSKQQSKIIQQLSDLILYHLAITRRLTAAELAGYLSYPPINASAA
jgi:hypothetical protein